MDQSVAKLVMGIGLLVFLGGALYYFLGDKLHWIGRLPGDIHIKRDNFSFYFPLTTMILFSVLVHFAIRLYRYFF